jgi:hypothetical protein
MTKEKFNLIIISVILTTIFVAILPQTVIAQQGGTKVLVVGDTIHDLNMKATQDANGQVNPVGGFAINPESVVQIKQNANLLIIASNNNVVQVKVSDTTAKIVPLTQIAVNTWSTQGFPAGIYNLDVIVDSEGKQAAYETILVILAPTQAPLSKTQTTTLVSTSVSTNNINYTRPIVNNTKPIVNNTTPTPSPSPNATSPITSINTTGTSKPSDTSYQSLPYNNATDFGVLFGTVPSPIPLENKLPIQLLAANNRTLPTPPIEVGYMPPTNNVTDEPAYCLTAFGPDPGYCNPEPEPAACGENTPAEELCRDEADMPPNEDTGAKEEEEQDEQDSDDGLSDWVAPTDDETEQEEEFDNDVEPEEEEEESEESEAETSEDEGGE